MKMSIVIPCYNEARNIPLIYERIKELDLVKNEIEIILVNNGSTDNSAEVFKQFSNFQNTKIVKVEVNQGYGFGILSGLKECTGEFLGWTHADMQTDPKDLLRAFNIIKENNFAKEIFVKGDRKGRPLFDQFFTSGMSLFETLYMGTRLYDINAQPNVFSRSFYHSWENPPNDFSLDLYAYYLAKKAKLKIKRFDVLFPERIHGESNWNTSFSAKWKFIKRTINFSTELKKRL
jgi:glycosyltransferase involved in cell wall biosynthesis